MDNIVSQIVEGFIQGVTEFLPISSSGHIVFLKKITGFSSDNLALQQIALHLGTLISILIYYHQDIKELFLKLNQRYTLYILIGTLPLVFSGLFLFDLFDDINNNIELAFPVASYCILITGFILFMTKFFNNQNRSLNWKIVLIIGFMQCLAVLPGISRSGITIASALLLGIKSKEAAKFSFFLSIPAIIGACIIKSKDLFISQSVVEFPFLGFLTSLFIGYIAIRLLIFITVEGRLWYFSMYCFLIGFLAIFFF